MEKARRAVQDTAASITADIKRLEAELATAEKALPADLKADYQRVVRSKGADSLAVADDGVCTGCGQQHHAQHAERAAPGAARLLQILRADSVPRRRVADNKVWHAMSLRRRAWLFRMVHATPIA